MSWEFDLLYAIQKLHHPILDEIMTFVSNIGNAGIFWILVSIFLIILPKYRKCGIQMVLAMLLTFIIGNLILKNAIARERPCWMDESIALLVANPKDYSFPSGHTMNGFTAALTLFFYDKKWGSIALALASVIAFSRLYHFVHFPTDVLAGMVVGITSAVVMHLVVKYWCSRRDKKRESYE